MKLKAILIGISFLTIGSTIFTSCSNETKKPSTEEVVSTMDTTTTDSSKVIVSSSKPSPISPVYESYHELVTELYTNNWNDAKGTVIEMKNNLSKVNLQEISKDKIGNWNKSSAKLAQILTIMEKSKDLLEARKHFADASDIMTESVKEFGAGKSVYVQNCPMAPRFKGEGANWLSETKDIENPFFGENDGMKNCGETKEEIK